MSVHKCRKQIAKMFFYMVPSMNFKKPLHGLNHFVQTKYHVKKTHSPRSCKSVSPKQSQTRGVLHCGLPFTVKSILMQKKNYENSNISPCKNIIFKKILFKKKTKSFKIS